MFQDIAQASTDVPWAGPASALGTAGILVYLVFYFLTKYIPDIEARHRAERSELHQDLMHIHNEHMAKLGDLAKTLRDIEENTRAIRGKQRLHDDDDHA